jgi:hypothetical protein
MVADRRSLPTNEGTPRSAADAATLDARMAFPEQTGLYAMDLGKKVKTALDETRTLMLGAQVLLGFGLRGVFQDGFDRLPAHARAVEAASLLLMILTVALLIAPGMVHRIAFGGADSGIFHRLVTRITEWALLPFAAGLGTSLDIVAERLFGGAGGLAAGIGFTALAFATWYGIEALRRRALRETARPQPQRRLTMLEKTPLTQRIEQMLTEARVILPGAQALLGFQLAIVITESFARLPALSQAIHAASIGCSALAVILLMAPAAYHRIVFAGEDTEEMHRVGSWFVTAATAPLALAIASDLYVVMLKIAESAVVATLAAVLALLLLVGFWHVLPCIVRRRVKGAARAKERDPWRSLQSP